jgi:hypothetical protein
MPAISGSLLSLVRAEHLHWADGVVRTLQSRQNPKTVESKATVGPIYSGEGRPGRDEHGLRIPTNVIIASVVSVVAFFALVTALCALFDYRRRQKAKKKSNSEAEVAMKEKSASVSDCSVDAPPPPYEAVHLPYRHPAVVHQWNNHSREVNNNNDAEGNVTVEHVELRQTVMIGVETGTDASGDRR